MAGGWADVQDNFTLLCGVLLSAQTTDAQVKSQQRNASRNTNSEETECTVLCGIRSCTADIRASAAMFSGQSLAVGSMSRLAKRCFVCEINICINLGSNIPLATVRENGGMSRGKRRPSSLEACGLTGALRVVRCRQFVAPALFWYDGVIAGCRGSLYDAT